jgi:SAM-dependent methyltransferase
MDSSLLSGGKHYNLLIDWKKRLSREIPFLMSYFDAHITVESSILSVGCGTGRHLTEIQKLCKCKITGIDIDASMIAEAEQMIPEGKFIAGDFVKDEKLPNQAFDLIFSLGNSIGLIASNSTFLEIIRKLKTLLKSEGILIFQLLNTMKERDGWSPPRTITTKDGEYIFLRGFQTSEDYVHPEIITLFRSNNLEEYNLVTTGRANIPRITAKDMVNILKQNTFKNIDVYGDYKKRSFDPSSSLDMIFVARI